MTRGRLEAFSDGVIAILITIMVLELKLPEGHDLASLRPMVPTLLCYTLSYVFLGIYWSNHHHLLHLVERVDGRILWANLHLLFWLSLIPVTTRWVGENPTASAPTAVYGMVMLAAGVGWLILERSIRALHGADSAFATALGTDRKGNFSALLYGLGVGSAFLAPAVAQALYVLVALMWLVPDRRAEAVHTRL